MSLNNGPKCRKSCVTFPRTIKVFQVLVFSVNHDCKILEVTEQWLRPLLRFGLMLPVFPKYVSNMLLLVNWILIYVYALQLMHYETSSFHN